MGFCPRRRLLGTPTYTVVSYERDLEKCGRKLLNCINLAQDMGQRVCTDLRRTGKCKFDV